MVRGTHYSLGRLGRDSSGCGSDEPDGGRSGSRERTDAGDADDDGCARPEDARDRRHGPDVR